MNDRLSSASAEPRKLSRAARISGILLACVLAALDSSDRLCAQESSLRSSGQRRVWPADERQQPRHPVRATHRGFEVSTGPIVVISTTSLEDARRAAEQAAEAWNDIAQLADRFTSVHRQPSFAQGAVQIVLDGDRGRQRDEPAQTLAPIGATTQIVVSLAPGQPELAQQQRQLRQNVASAFFHTAELDRQLPEWVCQGLAAYAGNPIADDGSTVAAAPAETADGDKGAELVRFLMEGNDGRHAGPFIELLREQLATARPDPAANFRRKNHSAAASQDSQRLDSFVSELAEEMGRWKHDPLIGQPLFASVEPADEVRHAQQEMLFVLKLADRFAIPETGTVRTKITMFDKGRGATVIAAGSGAKPPNLRTLLARITAESQPVWATLGPDGKLIWSSDEDKLRELLGVDENRYQHAWLENHWALQSKLADGRTLSGSLERSPEHPDQPAAKFVVQSPQ